jgi:hypothetical protein
MPYQLGGEAWRSRRPDGHGTPVGMAGQNILACLIRSVQRHPTVLRLSAPGRSPAPQEIGQAGSPQCRQCAALCIFLADGARCRSASALDPPTGRIPCAETPSAHSALGVRQLSHPLAPKPRAGPACAVPTLSESRGAGTRLDALLSQSPGTESVVLGMHLCLIHVHAANSQLCPATGAGV